MALTQIPPWLDISPAFFTNSASTGARIGLERAGLETNANDAARRLQLGYAQLASENANAGQRAGAAAAAAALENSQFQARMQQAAQGEADKRSALDALNQYRAGELGIRSQHEANQAYGNKLRRYMHVGNQIVDISGDQPTSVFSGPTQVDPYERMDYQEAVRRYRTAQTKLNSIAPDDKESLSTWQKELNDAKAELDKLKAKHSKTPFAADALNQPNWDQIPPAWSPPDGGMLPSPPANSQAALDASQTPPDDGSFSVGKYKVTPIPASAGEQ